MNEWISVKSKLPEETSDYLVTVGINSFGMGMYQEVRTATFNTKSGWKVHESGKSIIGCPIAWMPLPEPFKMCQDAEKYK